ncbi:hydrogenase expression/formation protein HypE [Corynebacterium pelargi]|uniref:Hydrogenase isoenzymes formation protein HypE n=1 Tax=Corynebacterium pelargi TaxID=1471400 RepID=A0A410WBU4_9CORY|nr:hydrogenase expression/formation protein HypE [Corynebacterium pelargi]QAU53415.1 Hydrogenase isoenzymes formation protein HypE [Corynebacterium pelargi]GGG82181.1 hydrogenase expression/formation protein HypE [Corynebacterium pelargi]
MDPKNRLNTNEEHVNLQISKVRERGSRLRDSVITLAHGAGGKASAALVQHVFFEIFDNEALHAAGDSGIVELSALGEGTQLAMSTDTYVVNPIEFPGGSIGELAVNGTVNDLAVAGACPKVITAAFVLEEGLDVDTLRRICTDMKHAAELAGVKIIAGDTKVVPKGACDKLYITTAGVGVVQQGRESLPSRVEVGDAVLVSGPIADHGMAVMMARGDLAMEAAIDSDTRSVNHLIDAMCKQAEPHFMRDATRGGVATVCNELAQASGLAVVLEDESIPVRPMTRGACDVLGIDPLYVANEGTFIAVVKGSDAQAALEALHAAGAEEAAIIGRIADSPAHSVVLRTGFGGTRMVDMLVGDPLPRIC